MILILFARVLFNCFASILFNCFARFLFNCFVFVLFNTLICLIFFVSNRLMIFLTPILFLLCNYITNIDGNVNNGFEMYSALLRIRCTSFWLPIENINIIFHVSVCGTYFPYLVIVYLHNIFHMNDGGLMFCAHAFVRLM